MAAVAIALSLLAVLAPPNGQTHAQVAQPVNADEDGSGDPSLGDTLTYQIIATNSGGITLTNVEVSDSLSGDTRTCPSVPPGGTCVLNATHVISAANLASGRISTTGTADSDQTGTVSLPTPATVFVPSPGLSVAAPAPTNADEDDSGSISQGDTLTYTITATNTGTANLTNVVVSDSLIAPSQGAIQCARISPGQTCVLQGTYVVTAGDVAAAQINNAASADSDQTGPAASAVSVIVTASPGIEVEAASAVEAGTDGVVTAGDSISLDFVVTNTGDIALTNVVVDGGVSGLDACDIGTLAPDGNDVCTLAYEVTQEDIDAGETSITGTAGGDSPTASVTADTTHTVEIEQAPGIAIARIGTLDRGPDGIASPGDAITYVFSVRNTGNTTLTGIVVQDEKVGLTSCTIASLTPGDTDDTTCAGSYAITQDDIDAGRLDDVAIAQANAPTGVVTATADGGSDPFSIEQNPSLDVARILADNADEDGSDGVSAGDSVRFVVTATNTGNIRLTNVRVGDELTGDETPCATLAPSGTCVMDYGYSVSAENGAQGGVPDLSYATSDQTGRVEPEERVSEVASARFEPPTNFLNVTEGLSSVSTDLAVVGTNISLALLAMLTLLVATTVFNSTLEENAAEVDAVVRRMSTSPGLAPIFAALGWMAADEAGGQARWLQYLKPLIIVLITACIYALLEPNFGFNEETLIVITALITGIAMATFLYEGGQVFWASKHYETPAAMRVYPLAILIALGCVGLTRITDLHPGIIFGFVTAAAIFPRGEMPERARGLIIAVPLLSLMLVSLIAFLLIDPLHDFAFNSNSIWASLPETIAVALFVGGAESALLILIPVTFNDGEKIWAWNKLIWFAFAVPASFAFFHVVVNQDDFGELVGDTGATALVTICLVVLAITAVTWLFFRLKGNQTEPA